MMEKLKHKAEDILRQMEELMKNAQKKVKQIEVMGQQAEEEVAEIKKASKEAKQIMEGELQQVEKIREDVKKEGEKAREARSQAESGAAKVNEIIKSLHSLIEGLDANLTNIKNRFLMNEDRLQKTKGDSKKQEVIQDFINRLKEDWVTTLYFLYIGILITLHSIEHLNLIGFRLTHTTLELMFWIYLGSCIYVILMFLFSKKRWFGLAVFLFVIAFLFMQVVIFESSQDKADIIILDGSITAGPIICANIKDVRCEPLGGDLFEENHRMVCNFKIAPPEQGILANSTHLNTTICPHIAIKHGIWYGSEKKNVRGYHTPIKKCEGDSKVSYIIQDYGDYWALPLLESSGYTNIEFQLICYNKSNEQIVETFENNLNKFIRTASKVRVEIHTKTNSEADEKRSNRNYQFIISLFALFGIFPAVYYLRNLYTK